MPLILQAMPRLVFAVAAVVVGAATLAGCSTKDAGNDSSAGGTVTINVALAADPADEDRGKPAISDLKNPGIKVKFTTLPENDLDRYQGRRHQGRAVRCGDDGQLRGRSGRRTSGSFHCRITPPRTPPGSGRPAAADQGHRLRRTAPSSRPSMAPRPSCSTARILRPRPASPSPRPTWEEIAAAAAKMITRPAVSRAFVSWPARLGPEPRRHHDRHRRLSVVAGSTRELDPAADISPTPRRPSASMSSCSRAPASPMPRRTAGRAACRR